MELKGQRCQAAVYDVYLRTASCQMQVFTGILRTKRRLLEYTQGGRLLQRF